MMLLRQLPLPTLLSGCINILCKPFHPLSPLSLSHTHTHTKHQRCGLHLNGGRFLVPHCCNVLQNVGWKTVNSSELLKASDHIRNVRATDIDSMCIAKSIGLSVEHTKCLSFSQPQDKINREKQDTSCLLSNTLVFWSSFLFFFLLFHAFLSPSLFQLRGVWPANSSRATPSCSSISSSLSLSA